jgi:hypothetical protein
LKQVLNKHQFRKVSVFEYVMEQLCCSQAQTESAKFFQKVGDFAEQNRQLVVKQILIKHHFYGVGIYICKYTKKLLLRLRQAQTPLQAQPHS